jgi:hypothetical protein
MLDPRRNNREDLEMMTLLLSLALAGPSSSYYQKPRGNLTYRKSVKKRQVDNVVRYLRKQDPQVVQQVMKKMGWMFRTEPRDACRKKKKSDREKLDDWEIRMLCDMAGIPCYKKR